jgi:hypothetical protein
MIYFRRMMLVLSCLVLTFGVNASIEDETVVLTVNAEIADADNFTFGSTNQYSTVVSRNGYIYVCWNDADYRPFLTKIDEKTGSSQTYPLDADEEDVYYAYADGHHQFSMGIDKDGYIHVLGDLHHGGNPWYRPPSDNPLPERFNGAEPYGWQLYWVSEQPEDISDFEFVGDEGDRVFPGWNFTYYHFETDMNGELYMMCRCSVREPRAHEPGTMGLGLFKYDADTRQWTALGAVPNSENPNYVNKAVIWEPHGHKNDEGTPWYQTYFSNLKFDRNNRLHITTPINADSTLDRATHIAYIYSDDGGQTFHRPNGELIPNLPARITDAQNQAGIAISIDDPGAFDGHFTGLFWDSNFVPAIIYCVSNREQMPNPNPFEYYRYYNPVSNLWISSEHPISMPRIRGDHHTGPDGIITLVGGSQIYRMEGFAQAGLAHNTNLSMPAGAGGGVIRQVDQRYLRDRNILRGISQQGEKIVVVSVEFQQAADEILMGDVNEDGEVNIDDILHMADNWLRNDCVYTNYFCSKADILKSGNVNIEDFAVLAFDWQSNYQARLLFDFGDPSITTPGNWNNITNTTTSASLSGAIDDGGLPTSVNYDCIAAFNVINTGGMTSTTAYPPSAGSDSFLVTSTPAKVKFSGLVPYMEYAFTFFGSRNDFLSRKLKVVIGTQSAVLETRKNTANTVEIIANADGSGEVVIDFMADGTTYGYLGVIEINGKVMAE